MAGDTSPLSLDGNRLMDLDSKPYDLSGSTEMFSIWFREKCWRKLPASLIPISKALWHF